MFHYFPSHVVLPRFVQLFRFSFLIGLITSRKRALVALFLKDSPLQQRGILGLERQEFSWVPPSSRHFGGQVGKELNLNSGMK